MKHLFLVVILAFSLSMALAGCGGGGGSNDDVREDTKEDMKEHATQGIEEHVQEAMQEKAQIPAEAEKIVYAGGRGWGPAIFKHKQHANEYYNGDCNVCHDHYEENLACGDCHTAGTDAEELCDEDADHGCIMRQCQKCHVNHGSPAPDGSSCGHCHEIPPYAEATILPAVLKTATLPEQMRKNNIS
ncbi:MAG: cytochrome c3 family protein [Deltaproteobacteria bacterium]|nr:cytochrome c3 family protein [Deltaproteobacteria bacterium]